MDALWKNSGPEYELDMDPFSQEWGYGQNFQEGCNVGEDCSIDARLAALLEDYLQVSEETQLIEQGTREIVQEA